MADPFRSELDAAHRRIEQLEAEHASRLKDLETENARLRQRLVDVAPSRTATGRTFGALGIMILAVSLGVGMVFARATRAPMPVRLPPYVPMGLAPGLELPSEGPQAEPTSTNPDDFDRGEAAFVLNHVHLEDCVKDGSPHVSGHIALTFAPSGIVTSATLDEGSYRDTPAGRCIVERFRAVRVHAFKGEPQHVGKSFVVP